MDKDAKELDEMNIRQFPDLIEKIEEINHFLNGEKEKFPHNHSKNHEINITLAIASRCVDRGERGHRGTSRGRGKRVDQRHATGKGRRV